MTRDRRPQRRTREAAAVLSASLVLAGLAACSPVVEPPVVTTTPDPVPSPVATPSVPPRPAAAPAAERPSPGFRDVPDGYYVVDDGRAMVPERVGPGCEGLPGLEPRSNDDEHRVHGYWYSSLRDVGPIDGARGEAVYDEREQPVAYVAAPGDTMSAVAARFCIDHYPYLEWINAIRRGDGTSVVGAGSMTLYAGDTLNLDPYTIATVGDENGVVHDNAVDFHIPPQR